MANYFLDGPDELAKLEFISRQQLLSEEKIMKNKINNYVQLVNALTGQEVFMPVEDDAYSFVSISSEENDEAYDDEIDEEDEIIEYVDEELVEDDDDDPMTIENIELMVEIPDAPPPVDNAPPPTPSQIIRKLKATLVEAGMCQIRNTKRKSANNKRLGDQNWSYDMAKRRLDRELKRIQKRRAYRDAVEQLPALAQKIQEDNDADVSPATVTAVPETASLAAALAEPDAGAVRDAATATSTATARSRPSTLLLQRQLSRRGSLSGSVFAGLLKTLDESKLPSGSPSAQKRASQARSKKYRSDERLQAILRKHHTNLKQEKAKLHNSSSQLPPPPPSE
ncbi:MAG: hypothetical protein SGBAC_005866 [Bacillariaceae sp.]